MSNDITDFMIFDPNNEHQILTSFVNQCRLNYIQVNAGTPRVVFPFKKFLDLDAWTFASDNGDGHQTPDAWSEKYGLMIDCMRVNDQEAKKGKNATYAREQRIRRELSEQLDSDMMSKLIVNAVDYSTPTDKHHNYRRYQRNVQRVLGEHVQQLPTYQHNHPGYKTLFFVFDESTPYFYDADINTMKGKPHLPWDDKSFMEPLIGSDLDMVIWYPPYKLFQQQIIRPPFAEPQITKTVPPTQLIDVAALNGTPLTDVNPNKVISGEV